MGNVHQGFHFPDTSPLDWVVKNSDSYTVDESATAELKQWLIDNRIVCQGQLKPVDPDFWSSTSDYAKGPSGLSGDVEVTSVPKERCPCTHAHCHINKDLDAKKNERKKTVVMFDDKKTLLKIRVLRHIRQVGALKAHQPVLTKNLRDQTRPWIAVAPHLTTTKRGLYKGPSFEKCFTKYMEDDKSSTITDFIEEFSFSGGVVRLQECDMVNDCLEIRDLIPGNPLRSLAELKSPGYENFLCVLDVDMTSPTHVVVTFEFLACDVTPNFELIKQLLTHII